MRKPCTPGHYELKHFPCRSVHLIYVLLLVIKQPIWVYRPYFRAQTTYSTETNINRTFGQFLDHRMASNELNARIILIRSYFVDPRTFFTIIRTRDFCIIYTLHAYTWTHTSITFGRTHFVNYYVCSGT